MFEELLVVALVWDGGSAAEYWRFMNFFRQGKKNLVEGCVHLEPSNGVPQTLRGEVSCDVTRMLLEIRPPPWGGGYRVYRCEIFENFGKFRWKKVPSQAWIKQSVVGKLYFLLRSGRKSANYPKDRGVTCAFWVIYHIWGGALWGKSDFFGGGGLFRVKILTFSALAVLQPL